MAKKLQKRIEMVKAIVMGHFPAANILDMESIKLQHQKMRTIEQFANEQGMTVKFTTVGKLIDVEEAPAVSGAVVHSDAPKTEEE